MRQALEASPPLCMPHLVFIVGRRRSSEAIEAVMAIELRKLAELRGDVAEFIKRNDYHLIGQGFGDVTNSWRDAVEAIVGEAGVF